MANAAQATYSEIRILLFVGFLLCIGQLVTRLAGINGVSTTAALSVGSGYLSTVMAQGSTGAPSPSKAAARVGTDFIGFCGAIIFFLMLLLVNAVRLSFTSDSLMTVLSGGNTTSLSNVLTTTALSFTSNVALMAIIRFCTNLFNIPMSMYTEAQAGNLPPVRRGRGRPRRNNR